MLSKKILKEIIEIETKTEIKKILVEQFAKKEEEHSLEQIADKFDLDLKNVKELIFSAERKIKNLTKGQNPDIMEINELEKLLFFIKETRKNVALKLGKYIKQIKNNDVFDFFLNLIRDGLFKKTDIDYISDKEIKNLIELSEKPIKEVIQTLLNDIEIDNNIFKSFQIAISRSIFSKNNM